MLARFAGAQCQSHAGTCAVRGHKTGKSGSEGGRRPTNPDHSRQWQCTNTNRHLLMITHTRLTLPPRPMNVIMSDRGDVFLMSYSATPVYLYVLYWYTYSLVRYRPAGPITGTVLLPYLQLEDRAVA